MRKKEKRVQVKVENVQSFIDNLPESNSKTQGLFYRGQSNKDFSLTPPVFRDNMLKKENRIYADVFTECAHEFDLSMSRFDTLSKMQDYGVPTRLLDITTNPLVALYFACADEEEKDKDGAVFVLRPNNVQLKQYDSDAVSIISCLPRFDKRNQDEILKLSEDCIKGKLTKNKFNKRAIIKRLLHEIKKENPAFEDIINPKDLLTNFFIMPKKSNPRIIRQSGAFIIFGLGERTIEVEDEYQNHKNYKIVIPKEAKDGIIKQLSCLGISKGTLNPELYKMAEYVRETYIKK